MTEEKQHHLYGGSSAFNWVNCQGWASLVKDLPPEPPSVHAARGTALHTGVLEVKTKGEIDHRLTGKDLIFDYSSIEGWPQEGSELAEEFWALVWERVLEQFITGKTIQIEQKLMLFPELDCGGTADFVVLYYSDKGKLVAVLGDCKFGKIRVEPDEEQLKFYLTALNKIVREKGKQIDEFRSFVYQPQHHDVFTEHKFTKSEIEKAESRYEKAIIESKKENPKFKVGDWCTYCKAQGKCLTYKKHLDKEMDMMIIRQETKVSFAPVETLSDEALAKITLFGDKVTKYISKVKHEVLVRFMNGQKVQGLKVIEGRANRKFKDEAHVAEEMQKLGVNPYKEPEIKGLGAMEAELVQLKFKKSEAKQIVDSFCEKPYGKPKITSSDSDKPDYQFDNCISLFDELEDSEG